MRRRLACWTLALCLLAQPAAAAGLEVLIVAAKPGVVAVGTYRATDSPRFGFRGTGFVVGKGDMVVTNAHVLPDELPSGTQAALSILTPKTGAGAESLRVFRPCPPCTPKHPRSSLQMLAIARAMAVLCA